MKNIITNSEFKHLDGIEYFDFEEDFMEHNIRCIPMIVRFKMDAVGIKLKLAEWSKFTKEERVNLALMPAVDMDSMDLYHKYLLELVVKHTGNLPTIMPINAYPDWKELKAIPSRLLIATHSLNISFKLIQWQKLTTLQRFALMKLCKSGHENKNLPKAFNEFGLNNHSIN